jgi:hypothetical protein
MTREQPIDLDGKVTGQRRRLSPTIAGAGLDDPDARRALNSARPGDEPSIPEEDEAAAEALAAYRRGEGATSKELRAEFDLD